MNSKLVPPSLKRAASIGQLGFSIVKQKILPRAADPGQIVSQMGSLHGLPQKIGQLLSLKEIGSDESTFTSLTTSGDALSVEEVVALVEAELGSAFSDTFSAIDETAFAASLGQVHRCILLDGKEVAVKVQYPGIKEGVKQDLASLGWLALPVSSKLSGFDLDGYRAVLRRSLERELSYEFEKNTLNRFQFHTKDCPWLVSPEPISQFCTEQLLVMSWEAGESFSALQLAPEDTKESIARYLVELLLRSWFVWKEVHADPHEGNLLFRLGEEPALVLLDFGCTRAVNRTEVACLKECIECIDEYSDTELRILLGDLGFDSEALLPMESKLRSALKALFFPFYEKQSVTMKEWAPAERMKDTLGDFRLAFRFAGPPDLLLFIRSMTGIFAYLKALDVAVNWWEIYESVVSERALVKRRVKLGVSSVEMAASEEILSNELRIRVRENGRMKVQLRFAAKVVESLREIMPEEVLESLENQAIDLDGIVAKALAQQCPPGELFSLAEGEKEVKVWLV